MNSMKEIGKEYGRLMEGERTGKTKAAVRGVECTCQTHLGKLHHETTPNLSISRSSYHNQSCL
jgi:hypothetical protein